MIDIKKVREDFRYIKDSYKHDECKQFADDDMQISVFYQDECISVDEAINELESLQQKETPMKVLNVDWRENDAPCPNCKRLVHVGLSKYCYNCGKHLDWSDE